MARINLLPWREELRRQRQQQFLSFLGVAVLVAGAAMVGVHFFVESVIEHQNSRNAYLQAEITKLDAQIKEIEALDRTKTRLLARMEIIQELQTSRPEIVHLFDELARTLPDGVFLTQVDQQGGKVELKGTAQSNARVSTYMWNLEKSQWLADPDLRVIETSPERGVRTSKFVLNALQARPKSEEEAVQ